MFMQTDFTVLYEDVLNDIAFTITMKTDQFHCRSCSTDFTIQMAMFPQSFVNRSSSSNRSSASEYKEGGVFQVLITIEQK